MKKIPCLFKRDWSKKGRPLLDEVLEGSEWVINGEGVATKKYDGTCCLIEKGIFYKRYTLKNGKKPPIDFVPATEVDKITGKQFGWRPVTVKDKYHIEAFNKQRCFLDGTYELCGPKVQGNPEKFSHHILIKHGHSILRRVPRDFDNLKKYLANNDMEGIVWHHPDGRMVKIKGVDFGINRKEQFKIRGMRADWVIMDDYVNDYNEPSALTKININKLINSEKLISKVVKTIKNSRDKIWKEWSK